LLIGLQTALMQTSNQYTLALTWHCARIVLRLAASLRPLYLQEGFPESVGYSRSSGYPMGHR